jgi:(1->4)-alpha-D-glucan 1-alpha-D-glucosylmutase
LKELFAAWQQALSRWHLITASARTESEGVIVPDGNEEYLFYQTLLGAWPLSPMTASDHEIFVSRITEYMLKTAKEAKLHTSWIASNHQHDQALVEFVQRSLEMRPGNDFLTDFTALGRELRFGNSPAAQSR